MKPYFKIQNLRGSIFIPLAPCDETLVNSLLKLLPGFMLSVNLPTPQLIKGIPMYDWLMFSSDKKSKLIFQQQKVDFIIESTTDYSPEVLQNFADKCNSIFEKILDHSNQISSRIAIAPTFKWIGDKDLLKEFVKEIFNKNSFKESEIDNCDFSQVFRVYEEINNMSIKLNYLSKFYVKKTVTFTNDIDNNTIQESYITDFDINTFVDSKYSFDKTSVCDFFSKATEFCTKFMEFYFNDK